MSLHSMFDAAHQAAPHAHHWAGQACHHGPHAGGVLLGVGLTALVFFLVRGAVRRRRFGGYGHGGCGPHGPHGHGPYGHGGYHGFHRGRRMLRYLFTRLETSPSQEKVIREAIDQVREAGVGLRGEGKELREALGDAFVGETFDAASLDVALAGPESRLREFRAVVASAMARVHEVLTPSQRTELAAMVAAGPGFFGRRGFGRTFG